LQEALALYQRVRSPAGEAVCRQFLGMTLTALGALDRGRRQLEAGLAVAQTSTMRSHVWRTSAFAAVTPAACWPPRR